MGIPGTGKTHFGKTYIKTVSEKLNVNYTVISDDLNRKIITEKYR